MLLILFPRGRTRSLLLEPRGFAKYGIIVTARDADTGNARGDADISVHRFKLAVAIIQAKRCDIDLVGIRCDSVYKRLSGKLIFCIFGILGASRAAAHANDVWLYLLQKHLVGRGF